VEIGDVDRVLDGDLDGLVEAELRNRRGHKAGGRTGPAPAGRG
jgi:hypothetical protein